MIRPQVEETVDALRSAVHSAGCRPGELSAVLLVGGSSRIPLVAQLVSEGLARPVAVDTDPKNAIAKGAALSVSPMPTASWPEVAIPPVPRAERGADGATTVLIGAAVAAGRAGGRQRVARGRGAGRRRRRGRYGRRAWACRIWPGWRRAGRAGGWGRCRRASRFGRWCGRRRASGGRRSGRSGGRRLARWQAAAPPAWRAAAVGGGGGTPGRAGSGWRGAGARGWRAGRQAAATQQVAVAAARQRRGGHGAGGGAGRGQGRVALTAVPGSRGQRCGRPRRRCRAGGRQGAGRPSAGADVESPSAGRHAAPEHEQIGRSAGSEPARPAVHPPRPRGHPEPDVGSRAVAAPVGGADGRGGAAGRRRDRARALLVPRLTSSDSPGIVTESGASGAASEPPQPAAPAPAPSGAVSGGSGGAGGHASPPSKRSQGGGVAPAPVPAPAPAPAGPVVPAQAPAPAPCTGTHDRAPRRPAERGAAVAGPGARPAACAERHPRCHRPRPHGWRHHHPGRRHGLDRQQHPRRHRQPRPRRAQPVQRRQARRRHQRARHPEPDRHRRDGGGLSDGPRTATGRATGMLDLC
jgi:hypothetical protein